MSREGASRAAALPTQKPGRGPRSRAVPGGADKAPGVRGRTRHLRCPRRPTRKEFSLNRPSALPTATCCNDDSRTAATNSLPVLTGCSGNCGGGDLFLTHREQPRSRDAAAQRGSFPGRQGDGDDRRRGQSATRQRVHRGRHGLKLSLSQEQKYHSVEKGPVVTCCFVTPQGQVTLHVLLIKQVFSRRAKKRKT